MTYLVLGSAGQIGKPLVNYLKSKNEQVIEYDIKDGTQYDLRYRSEQLEDAINRSDFVMFLAYDVGGSKYLEANQSKLQFIENNLAIMSNVFNFLRNKPFIFASSQMAQFPKLAYGALKNVGAHYARALDGMVVNLYNVYGIETENEKAHVITDFVTQARDNKVIRAKTNGIERRQFLHVDDCVRALYVLSKSYSPSNYDVTSFKWTSIFEIAMIVSSLFNRIPVHFTDKFDAVNCEPIEPSEDILKLWSPEISLADGIRMIRNELCE